MDHRLWFKISHAVSLYQCAFPLRSASSAINYYLFTTEMSSNILKINLRTTKQLDSISFHCHLIYPWYPIPKGKFSALSSIHCNLSSPTPPKSKEDAVRQAKTCLITTLEKPLNNPNLPSKLKKLKQPRFRVEIPVIDDSPSSLSQLALEVFGNMPIRRKGSKIKTLILWPNRTLADAAIEAFQSKSSNSADHIDVSSVTDTRNLNVADVAVFFAPEPSQLQGMEAVTNGLYPKPVVIFNPKWSVEEESGFGELTEFLGSFEVIYSFMGLEVRGLLSKRNGVVFKCVRDGVLSGERWSVLVEEGGELKVVSRFKTRPSIDEVENVLYNMMAINSPITKSVQFFKGLVSNVTRRK